MNKYVSLFSLTALLMSSFASNSFAKANSPTASNPNNSTVLLSSGFYIGGSIGYDLTQIRNDYHAQAVVSHGTSVLDTQDTTLQSGFVSSGFLGYRTILNDYLFLGTELFLNGNRMNKKTNQFNITHSHEIGIVDINGATSTVSFNRNYGIGVLPGIKINNSSLAYSRLGYKRTNISVNESIILFDRGVTPLTLTPFSHSTTRDGFNFGLGIETAIVKNLSVRGEVNHTNYGSFTTTTGRVLKVADTQALVSLIYLIA